MKLSKKILIISLVLPICFYSFSASAQGFRGLLKKIEALETKLQSLEKSRSTEMESIQNELRNLQNKIEKSDNAGLDSEKLSEMDTKINTMSDKVNLLSSTVNNNSMKLDTSDFSSSNDQDGSIEYANDGSDDTNGDDQNGNEDEDTVVGEFGSVSVSAGVDFMSRYVWRGADFGNTPSIQPGLSFGVGGFEFGFWGAYTLSNSESGSDENDIWMSYTHEFENSASISAVATDYYFPNAGTEFFNFNDHDDIDGAGAHTYEIGLSISGPESFPLTFSSFVNVYNDPGNNAYFEISYSRSFEDAEVNFFIGGTPGSDVNPGYYGSESFSLINIGLQATREIKFSDNFSLPINLYYIVNPKLEQSYLVVGFTF